MSYATRPTPDRARLEKRDRGTVVQGVEFAGVVLTQDARHIDDDVGGPQAR